MKKDLFNFIGFHSGWWACVIGVQNDYDYLGVFVMSIYLLIHLIYFRINNNELYIILISGFVGAVVDSILLITNFVEYEGLYSKSFAPFWIISMWMGFSSTLNHSLKWLDLKWISQFLLGFIFGPLSYIAGVRLGALYFNASLYNIFILGLVWGAAVPTLYLLNNKLVKIK